MLGQNLLIVTNIKSTTVFFIFLKKLRIKKCLSLNYDVPKLHLVFLVILNLFQDKREQVYIVLKLYCQTQTEDLLHELLDKNTLGTKTEQLTDSSNSETI